MGQADGCDDRVERENHVEKNDLDDRRGEACGDATTNSFVVQFDHVMDLFDRLPQQEETSRDEDDVTPRERKSGHDRRGELNQPKRAGNKHQPRRQRDKESDDTRTVTLVLRQTRNND